MKVRVDNKKPQSASEVNVVEEINRVEEVVINPAYCFARAAEELRSKNFPMNFYSSSGSNLQYVTDHASARLWIDLGNALIAFQENQ